MGITEEILLQQTWTDFIRDRTERNRFTDEEALLFTRLVESGDFRLAAEKIFTLSTVQKKLVNKGGSDKKRVVYTFSAEENAVLKVIAYLLYRYDHLFPQNLYSFRRGIDAKAAISQLTSAQSLDGMWVYKLDVSNYFNSIDVSILLGELSHLINDEAELRFFSCLLEGDSAVYEGQVIHEKRGVMAGTPTSPFLANVYLTPLDRHFESLGIPYARYSDDIILFAPTEDELNVHRLFIADFLLSRGLCINTDKEAIAAPFKGWSFLGIAYKDGRIDLSANTKDKLKGKIRRKARSLYRWKLRKGATDEQAVRAFIRTINRKLYVASDDSRFCWTRWFFPLLTTDEGLHELDEYLVRYVRFVGCGSFGRDGYRLRYEKIKQLGLRPLVSEYWKMKTSDS